MYNQKKYFDLLAVTLVIWKLFESTAAIPTTYDQQQTGEVNVQIDMKDVQILALVNKEFLDDYTDYNYVYDYEDFTIKPITKPTTSTSPTATAKPSSAWPTVPSTTLSPPPPPSTSTSSTSSLSSLSSLSIVAGENISISSDTASSLSSTPSIFESENITIGINENNVTTPKIDTITKSENNLDTTSSNDLKLIAKISEKKCRSGTIPDGNGRCRKIIRRRTSFLPKLAVRLTPK